MNRIVFIYLFLAVFLVGCGGIVGEDATPVLFGQVPAGDTPVVVVEGTEATNTPTPVQGEPTEVVPATEQPATLTPVPEEEGTPQPAAFRQLRFATTEDGVSQVTFLRGTQEIYALWDYVGITNGDTMRRIWYLNDQLFVERSEAWNFGKYGSSGTIRDVFMYDYIDGVDSGRWRVELYLNGELQVESGFTVQ